MSKSIKSGTSDESTSSIKTITDVEDKIEELELTASGMLDLLNIVATAESDKETEDDLEKCASGIYLLADVQTHFVKALYKVEETLETLEQKIKDERKAENAPAI